MVNYDDLDSSEGDARIVAEVLNVRGVPPEHKVVVSQDINPLFMAKRHGLSGIHVSDEWLQQPEPSPSQKEISKLKLQVADYAKTEPEFQIKFSVLHDVIEMHKVEDLSPEEQKALTISIIEANPKPIQEYNLMNIVDQRDPSLDSRYAKYESKIVPSFVKAYSKKLETLFGQIAFEFTIENVGKVRADHANFEVRMIGGWINDKPFITGTFPVGPKARNNMLYREAINFPNLNVKRTVGRHEVDFEPPKRAQSFSAECENFRHGQKWEFKGVLCLDPNYANEAKLIIKTTASNLHGDQTQIFVLNKSVSNTHPYNLADKDTGKISQDFNIKKLFLLAIDNQAYEDIEWDKIEDD